MNAKEINAKMAMKTTNRHFARRRLMQSYRLTDKELTYQALEICGLLDGLALSEADRVFDEARLLLRQASIVRITDICFQMTGDTAGVGA